MTDEATQEYKVVWEKWADPYGENMDEIEWPGWDDNKEEEDVELEDSFDVDELEKLLGIDTLELEKQSNSLADKSFKVIVTPMGIVPITEYTMPSKIFNFWVCHTNFSITPDIQKIVEAADGVETLDIFTRYRMRIGIGKTFDTTQSKYGLTQKLLQHMKEGKVDASTKET